MKKAQYLTRAEKLKKLKYKRKVNKPCYNGGVIVTNNLRE